LRGELACAVPTSAALRPSVPAWVRGPGGHRTPRTASDPLPPPGRAPELRWPAACRHGSGHHRV